MEHDLTVEWLLENLTDECPVFKIPFSFTRDKHYYDSPTVDRIDNNRGYTRDNCWIISGRANRLKGESSLDEMALGFKNLTLMIQKRSKQERVREQDVEEAQRHRPRGNPYAQ